MLVLDGGCAVAPACPDGFTPHASGVGCVEIAPALDCPAGTRASIGSTECVPVGWTSCPQGFVADPSGWGCAEVLPAATCPSGSMARLGFADCQPIGDCARPFPPPTATHFVDANGPQGDGVHFRKVFDAVLAAPAGSVIAIADGAYVENVDVDKPLTLEGRCAATTTLRGPGDNRAGVLVVSGGDVTVRGLTLEGHVTGVYVKSGGAARVEDVAFLRNRWMGAYAVDPGSRLSIARSLIDATTTNAQGEYGWGVGVQVGAALTLTDSTVSGSHQTGVGVSKPGTQARLERVVVRGTRANAAGTGAPDLGVGVSAAGGPRVDLVDCLVAENEYANVTSRDPGTVVHVEGSLLRDALLDPSGQYGRNVEATTGATIELVGAEAFAAHESNVVAVDPGSRVTLSHVTVRGFELLPPDARGEGVIGGAGTTTALDDVAVLKSAGVGVVMQDGAALAATGLLVRGTTVNRDGRLGMGVQVSYGGTATLTDSALVANTNVALLVTRSRDGGAGARVSAERLLVKGTLPTPAGYGFGVHVNLGATATLTRSAIVDNLEAGVSAALDGGVTLTDSVVRGTRRSAAGLFGHGLIAEDGTVEALRSSVRDNDGIGAAFSDATGLLSQCAVTGNQVGIHVQGTGTLKEADAAPASLPSGEIVVTHDTSFDGNGAKLGVGVVPLPGAVTP